MTIITVIRSAPEPPPFSPITLATGPTVSSFESMVAIASSLSGPLDDYSISEQFTPAGTLGNVTAKASYQDRFRQRTLELKTLRDQLKRLQNRRDDQELCFITVEIYTRICDILQTLWWKKLPRGVRRLLKGQSKNLPCILTSWGALQRRVNPEDHSSLVVIGDYCHEDRKLEDLMVGANRQETQFGIGVHLAWDLIDPLDRNLMMVCWVMKQDQQDERAETAHPIPSKLDAMNIIGADLPSPLFDRAASLIGQDTKRFGGTSVFFTVPVQEDPA